jgi:8-oxo-dGTP pyrophosphatase MutT (NUDIX family)
MLQIPLRIRVSNLELRTAFRGFGDVMDHINPGQIMQNVRRLFGGEPVRLQVAALPWRRTGGGIEVMLITSRVGGRWVLPKGWPETGEELCAAAAREAHEEAGLIGAVSSSMAGRYTYVKSDAVDGMRCEVMVYPLEVGASAGKWKEKGQRRRKWLSPDKAAKRVAETELAELIRDFAGALQAAA